MINEAFQGAGNNHHQPHNANKLIARYIMKLDLDHKSSRPHI